MRNRYSFFTGEYFQLGKWTKICSLHFLPTDFYNFWGNYRTLKEEAVPSVFPFATKKITPRRKLVRVGRDESNEEEPVQEEMIDSDLVAADAGQNSEHGDQREVQSEVTAQFEAAKDEIEKLKKMLDEARLQIVELQESVGKKRFSIEAI